MTLSPAQRLVPAQDALIRDHRAAPPAWRSALIAAAGLALALFLAGTVALWAHYGTAVFYEMMAAALAACL